MKIYLIERTDNIVKHDSVVSMVVVAKDETRAKELALTKNWGDIQNYGNKDLISLKNLKATEIRLNKEQIVLIDFLNG